MNFKVNIALSMEGWFEIQNSLLGTSDKRLISWKRIDKSVSL
jgi:hypothetical protein